MKKKKKHSIKVAKDSNHSARARPISDPVPCDPSLCSASSNDNTYKTSLCTAIKSIQSKYNTYSSQISDLYDSAKGNAKQASLTVIIDIFSDFLTLYTDCFAKVTFLNKDFCSTINWGGCKPPDVLGRSNLNDLLNKGSKAVTNFTTWDKLYEPNMKTMLFSNVSGSGKSFAQALTDLGTPGAPVANPFLAADLQTDLSTGMSGVDPNTGASTGTPTFNFETNFNTIYGNIKKLIPATPASSCPYNKCSQNKFWTNSVVDGTAQIYTENDPLTSVQCSDNPCGLKTRWKYTNLSPFKTPDGIIHVTALHYDYSGSGAHYCCGTCLKVTAGIDPRTGKAYGTDPIYVTVIDRKGDPGLDLQMNPNGSNFTVNDVFSHLCGMDAMKNPNSSCYTGKTGCISVKYEIADPSNCPGNLGCCTKGGYPNSWCCK